MWVIVKMIPNFDGIKLPVIILNGDSEILEFETQDEAMKMKTLFETNSDSGYEYIVKEL